MPTAVGPNTKGEENLVFGYDLGDVSNSYKGEPTTNLLNTVNIGSFAIESGATRTATGNSYLGFPTYNIATNPTETYRSVYTNFTNVGTGTYVASIWYRNNGGTAVSQDIYFGGANRGTGGGSIPADGQWHRRVVIVTNPSDTIFEPRPYTLVEAAAPQVEYKSHATPFITGTRSATQGLIDLTGNSTIDLSNVSFDSNAQMTFDGTDDKAVVANFPHIWDGSVTMEAVVAWNDDSRSIIFGNYNVGANDINFEKLTGRALRFYWNRGERDVTTSSNVVTTTGNPHHVVMIRDKGSNSFKFYVDGEEIATSSNVGTDVSSTGSTFRIGGDSRDGTTIHNGDIPLLKLYNRALTASEIKANYNAIKGRFNI